MIINGCGDIQEDVELKAVCTSCDVHSKMNMLFMHHTASSTVLDGPPFQGSCSTLRMSSFRSHVCMADVGGGQETQALP